LSELEIGEVVKLPDLDLKDIKCANAVISHIPEDASVSGPDNLGDHLSMRETYGIFPALWNKADYVIVDVQSRKLVSILGLNKNIIKDLTENLVSTEEYELVMACGNLYLFKKGEPVERSGLIPIQERFEYPAKYDFEVLDLIRVVDFSIPDEVTREKVSKGHLVYQKIENDGMDGYLFYITFVNKETEKIFQVANLPSFAFLSPPDWTKNLYYKEDIDIALPSYVEPGEYSVFFSLSNKIKMRSMYLGDVLVN